jgi:hypothetical protein
MAKDKTFTAAMTNPSGRIFSRRRVMLLELKEP